MKLNDRYNFQSDRSDDQQHKHPRAGTLHSRKVRATPPPLPAAGVDPRAAADAYARKLKIFLVVISPFMGFFPLIIVAMMARNSAAQAHAAAAAAAR